ncbi:MAG: metal-dependent hydrolase [Leptospiraceae bacterium]|nr:metal-dependent hydrolase [Leptospiraceae bacterium]
MTTAAKTEANKDAVPAKRGGTPEQIKPHRIDVQFDESLPKHWFGDSAFLSHVLNTWTAIFPDAERYFVRWSKKALASVTDAQIKKDIQGFIGQETMHANQHEKLWDLLRAQGYNLDPVLWVVQKVAFDWIEKAMPDKANYALVAGLEHFTAMFGEIYFENPELMNKMHGEMKRLFEWHAAEEIEHKAVAYDQLMQIDDSYALRTGVMNLAVVGLYLITFGNAFYFMAQDRSLFNPKEWLTIADVFFGKYDLARKTLVKFLEYYKPGFHPWDNENYHLAQPTLAQYEKKAS